MDPSLVFGVNPHWVTNSSILQQARAMNIRWARMDFGWQDVEQSQGVYTWGILDSLYNTYKNLGFQMLGGIGGTPAWASSNGKESGYPKDSTAAQHWVTFVQAILARYPLITYWEPWNEPNNTNFWVGNFQQYYSLILKPAADAIHAYGTAHNTTEYVVAPTLSDTMGNEPSFFAQLKSMGASAIVDVLSQNLYYTNWSVSGILNGWNSRVAMYNQNGFTSQPIWVTETGMNPCANGASNQAGYILANLELRPARATNTFIYELQDSGDCFGIFTASGQQRLIGYYLSQIGTASCQCPDFPWCL